MAEFFENFLKPTQAIYTMWVIMAVILVLSFIATRKMKTVPGPMQNVAEAAVSKLFGFFEDVLGEKKTRQFFPILGTFFVLIIVCNYTGLIPGAGNEEEGLFTVPTSVLAITAGLAVIAFFVVQTAGIKKFGARYFLSFFKPVWLLFPIMLLEQFTRPLSLALRLYGNIYGEELATDTLFGLVHIGLPIVMNVLSLLFCLIQAMVFTLLLAVYINEATEDEEED